MDENRPHEDFGNSPEDLEELYQRALETMEEVETDLSFASEVLNRPTDQAVDEDEPTLESDSDLLSTTDSSTEWNTESLKSLRNIVEAALFVGGKTLTTKKLCALLQGEYQPADIEQVVENLNYLYHRENRPYTIHLGEGGYYMAIREEYETVRNRVFGLGPKEVRLSQDALEVLAFVAYRQPVTPKDLGAIEKKSSHGILQQLIRRQLIVIDRDETEDSKVVAYKTSDRFLKLFGISELEELPIAAELEYK